MDAMLRGPDGSGKCDLFLSFSPSVSYQQHPSEVHARAAYGANNFTDGQDSALTYPPKLQKRLMFVILYWILIYEQLLPENEMKLYSTDSSVN